GSNDSTPDARFWINFADGNDPINQASTEIVTLFRSACGFSEAAARVSWRLQTSRQDWNSAEVTVRYLDSELILDTEDTLELVFSLDGSGPFIRLASAVNPLNNTINTNISQSGFLYIGDLELVFSDGFESLTDCASAL
ncbi:MAG: hypothetical protein AAGH65_10340, partial [Pseudomonadota bacterium]